MGIATLTAEDILFAVFVQLLTTEYVLKLGITLGTVSANMTTTVEEFLV